MLRAAYGRLSFIPLTAIALAAVLGLLTLRALADDGGGGGGGGDDGGGGGGGGGDGGRGDDRPDPSKVKDIKTFIACLNMIKGDNSSIADVVKCVPPCCNFVVTMSKESAQGACELAGCKLPRVIFDCPGPTGGRRFRPSFLLCPTDSKGAGNQFGTDRAELGEDVDDKGNMKMADVPAPPGATDLTTVTAGDVLSKVKPGKDLGTKGCNGCHSAPVPGADADNNQLSEPIDPFGTFGGTDLAPLVIDTDEPGKTVDPKVKMTLKQICECIEKNKDKIKEAANDPNVVMEPGDRNPNLDLKILLKLCKKLEHKIPRTPCVTPRDTHTPTPSPMPPTQTPSHTPNPTPSNTPKNTPTATRVPTHAATATNTTAPTKTNTSTPTATGVPTGTATATNTVAPTKTNTSTPTATGVPTGTATATNTPSPTATRVPTHAATATNTTAPTKTNTFTPTATLVPTGTATATNTTAPTKTNTSTATATLVPTGTATATNTAAATATGVPTGTATARTF